jgi:hypothetical protein
MKVGFVTLALGDFRARGDWTPGFGDTKADEDQPA